jgi:hypothetical protein
LEAGVSTETHAMKCAVTEKFGPEIGNLVFEAQKSRLIDLPGTDGRGDGENPS